MFNRLRVIIVMIIFSVSFIFSSEPVCEEEKQKHDFKGYFMIGGSTLDIDALNSRLGNKGYSELSDTFLSIGGGGLIKGSDKVLLGFEGQMLIGGQESSVIGSENYSLRIIGGYGFLNTGYLVYSSDRLDLFPILGIGFGGMGMKIVQTSFDNILDNPHSFTTLSTYSFLLNFAIGTNYKIKLSGDETEKKFFIVGLRGGYAFSPFKSGWYQDEFELTGAPDGGINGPYVRLTIGGSGKVKK
ncbi:hypothetical protein ACFL1R_04415 [Candidatus Latescibacterota bacterium]